MEITRIGITRIKRLGAALPFMVACSILLLMSAIYPDDNYSASGSHYIHPRHSMQ
ncbi:hypothetical protein KR018_012536 [Drosophila ironensis]|nr:hypothetical protein KR018_012536 [Drosophila ironensis]